jgi:hypothetical protein
MVKAILPPDNSPVTVTGGTYFRGGGEDPEILVMIEIEGGPVITLTPRQWASLVHRIRGASTARELGA